MRSMRDAAVLVILLALVSSVRILPTETAEATELPQGISGVQAAALELPASTRPMIDSTTVPGIELPGDSAQARVRTVHLSDERTIFVLEISEEKEPAAAPRPVKPIQPNSRCAEQARLASHS